MNDITPNQPPRIMNDIIHPSVIAGLQWIKDQDSTREPQAKAKITLRALYQRINRRLMRDYDERLRTARSMRMELDVGHYFTLDIYRNCIARHDVDLEELGRELGVMQPWEQLEEDTK